MDTQHDKVRKQIKRLANNMDQKAESCNAHDFVITHRALAVLIAEECGLGVALRIMRAIRKAGGLPALTGVAGTGQPPFFLEKRGISENWGDWEMPAEQ